MNITIVTDSSSYFKKSEAQELGIKVVAINYNINGQSYFESYSDCNGDFENLFDGSGQYTTSHPNMSAFLSAFEEEIRNGNKVLCITMSSRLSGTYGTAHAAAKLAESENVEVFDSKFTAGGLYLLIKEAKKLIDSGLSLHEVYNKLPTIRDRISTVFSVEDMTPLRRSGRIGFVRLSVSNFLNIEPILACEDGAVVSDSIVARGSTELIKKLAAKVNSNTRNVVVNYIGNNRLATNLYHVTKKAAPHAEIILQKVGPALGVHLGLKVISVSCIQADSKDLTASLDTG